ncbi:hypothetical protein G7092_15405 [Mucilaginibacter sp. HC2]|uniref:hypothetical protein n=1 Tax=Mucilaginibacter inviolabilis TaxID=2714892 RepID=UPI001409DB85|nr:hypothetical protein [Mucilaginibacter inviolabilis]NHA05195.1 hypothetical protein [Mucilaginibacter inviolabilis]
MKQYPKLSFLLLACIAIGYSACIKSANNNNNKNNSSTVSTKVVSSTVAMNLKQILYGEYGSFNIADGANMPDDMNQSHKGHLKVQSTHAPDCGFKIDTAFQFALDLSDTAKFSIWNKIKYNVQCTGSSLSGISVYDSLYVSITSNDYIVLTKSGETLNMKLLTPGNKDSQLSMTGSMNVYTNLQAKATASKTTISSYNYSFNSLIIDPTKEGDIISGSASFATKGSGADGTWDYKGTIQFLGNHQVKIVINGSTYTYDLQTGLAV